MTDTATLLFLTKLQIQKKPSDEDEDALLYSEDVREPSTWLTSGWSTYIIEILQDKNALTLHYFN